ncbi:zinc ribbon domain-containing protein [Thermosulfurimonas sp. F29]|uniref:zinc ribbon domain-containing protein n=1 Tax=Thermosulfurimonas sp. F29 TaxID=2867247 RepID=UPI001C838C34|nr:C4-type zinc ribbon domain-containing protein [Thermosulfurimonas sp. F29]MBX6422839.1 hypothetical protein [Thermosulfurimonas sp. F29]
MREEIATLIKLQEIDLKIIEIERRKNELPETLRQAEETLSRKRQQFEEISRRLEEIDLKRKTEEEELEEEYQRLRKTQTRLMQIRGSREYQALLREIEEIKKANKQREENLLRLMEEQETLKKEEETLRREIEELEKKVADERAHYEAQCRRLEEEKTGYLREREALAEAVPQNLLNRYEFIRQRRGGLAIVAVENGTCEGCHMHIPPQLFNELQRDDRYYECPLCRRLIYYKKIYFPEAEDSSEDTAPSET